MLCPLKRFSVACLSLFLLVGCGGSLPITQKKVPANNQFRLHQVVWDVNLPDVWKRISKPLDETIDIPFFATDETQNIVILPGSGFKTDLITDYVNNGETKFDSFAVINQSESSLKFKGALAEGSDIMVFDQRIFRWEGSNDLFLIFSCNYPEDFTGDDCELIFNTIQKPDRQTDLNQ